MAASIFAPSQRQALISSLFILLAYVGWFFTRSHIKVTQNVLTDQGILTSEGLGIVTSVGYVVNVFSKVAAGSLIDMASSVKIVFLAGLFVSATMVAANTFLTTIIFWILFLSAINLVSAVGRLGTFKMIAMRWPKEQMGIWGGMINAAANGGEVLSKIILGALLSTMSWQGIFFTGSATAIAMALPLLFFVSDRSKTPAANKASPNTPAAPKPEGSFFERAVKPLFRMPRYWLIMALAFTTTALRETLNAWLPKYLRRFAYLKSGSTVVMLSSVYNVAAILSSLSAGALLDRVSKPKRGLVTIVFLIASAAMFAGLMFITMQSDLSTQTDFLIAFVLLGLASFTVVAPNSFLEGVFLVDIVDMGGLALASGIVGASGYGGSAIFSYFIGKLDQRADGWSWIWTIAVGLNAVSVLAAFLYWTFDRRAALKEADDKGEMVKVSDDRA